MSWRTCHLIACDISQLANWIMRNEDTALISFTFCRRSCGIPTPGSSSLPGVILAIDWLIAQRLTCGSGELICSSIWRCCSQSLSSLEGDNGDSSDDEDAGPQAASLAVASIGIGSEDSMIGGLVPSSTRGGGGHVAYGTVIVGSHLMSTSPTGAFGGPPTTTAMMTATKPPIKAPHHDGTPGSSRKDPTRKSKLLRRNTMSSADNGIDHLPAFVCFISGNFLSSFCN